MASPVLSKPGVLGVAPLPGTSQVLDRTTHTLANCTTALCGLSYDHDAKYLPGSRPANRAPFSALHNVQVGGHPAPGRCLWP